GAGVEGVDQVAVLEAELLEHPPRGEGLGADLADDAAGLRREEGQVDLVPRQQVDHELLGVLAEAVRLLVGEVDEAAAEVLPEDRVPVGADGTHHLRDDAVGEEVAVEGDELEADEADEAAELLGVAAEVGLEDQAADLGGAGLVEVELGGDVRAALLEGLAEELPLGELEGEVGVPGPAHAGDDLAGAQ